MYDITKTRMLLMTAVFAAVAALFACGGANAMLLVDGGYRGGALLLTSGHQLDTAIGTAMATRAAKTVPLFTSGHQLDTAIGTAMATRAAKTVPLFTSGHQLDTAIGTAMATRAAKIAQASIGIGVEAAELTRPCSPQESREAC